MNKSLKKLLGVMALSLMLSSCGGSSTNQDSNTNTDSDKSTGVTTPVTGGTSTPTPTGSTSTPTVPTIPQDEYAQHPEIYYRELTNNLSDGENGQFRNKLTSVIHPGETPKYGGNSGNYILSDVLQDADEDPNNKDNMIFFYTQESKPKGGSNSGNYWNREHVWPQNNSNGCWGQIRAGSDMLHIRPTYESTNSARGNLKYGRVNGSYEQYQGHDFGKVGAYFEPTHKVKGDAARIIMYVWTAYHEEYGSDLPEITDTFESIDVMLEWHLNDLPSAYELHRNEVAAKSKQRNRNPFVDHPEYACRIWGNTSNKTKQLCNIR